MVHGISPDQTKNHPTFPEIWDIIKDYQSKSNNKKVTNGQGEHMGAIDARAKLNRKVSTIC